MEFTVWMGVEKEGRGPAVEPWTKVVPPRRSGVAREGAPATANLRFAVEKKRLSGTTRIGRCTVPGGDSPDAGKEIALP
jgi:hypothetical protein